MSIKSFEDLNKVLETLSTDPHWTEVSSEVKAKLVNQYHEELGEKVLQDAVKKHASSKKKRARKRSASHSDGGHEGGSA